MIGLITVLFSAFILTFHNITVRILFSEQLVLGLFLVGGYVQPNIQNAFLLMFMRMLLVVPLMALLSVKLYPSALKEFKELIQSKRWNTVMQAIGCGVLMFTYIAMLYVSIGLISTGIAMTLFFTYPVFTALFSWRFFGDRPTPFRWAVMGIILLGGILTIPQSGSLDSQSMVTIGILASVGSGVIYALYSVIAQQCVQTLHPILFTWISFAMTLLLSGACLLVHPLPTLELAWTPLWIGGLFSGLVSFVGHTLNNLGIRMIGATATAMIGSSSPAMTAIIAWAIIHETLNSIQVIGIGIVTLGIALLSGERVWMGRS